MEKRFDIMAEDARQTCANERISWTDLEDRTILITGANGLIGVNLLETMRVLREERGIRVSVIGLVRDEQKIPTRFANRPGFSFVIGSVEDLPPIEGDVDYVIHAASPTSSRFFLDHPVETIHISVRGTMNLLELARKKASRGFAYLSSMEVYGHPPKGTLVTEKNVAGFDPTNPRNSYPISKILCESLCLSYFKEYGLPTFVLRLTQTFGPGMQYNDGRVFAEFVRCVLEKRDIILKTTGETERSYLYTADAVQAIFAVLLNGKAGECYNAANENTYCSIAEMAHMVADETAGGQIAVRYELEDVKKLGYADILYMKLDTTKLSSLGWTPCYSLKEMYERLRNSILYI